MQIALNDTAMLETTKIWGGFGDQRAIKIINWHRSCALRSTRDILCQLTDTLD